MSRNITPPLLSEQGAVGTSVRLEFSELQIRFLGVHAAEDGAAHLVFGLQHLFRFAYNLLHDPAGNDHHAVAVRQQPVSRAHRNVADRNGLTEPVRHPAADDVGRGVEAAEYRETQFEYEVRVAAAAT